MTSQTNDAGKINGVELVAPLKYLINFWRTLEMSLINCEVNFILTWSANCAIISTNNSKSYICNNRNKSLRSSSYFINAR